MYLIVYFDVAIIIYPCKYSAIINMTYVGSYCYGNT